MNVLPHCVPCRSGPRGSEPLREGPRRAYWALLCFGAWAALLSLGGLALGLNSAISTTGLAQNEADQGRASLRDGGPTAHGLTRQHWKLTRDAGDVIYAADLSAPFVRSEDRWPLDVVGQGEEPAPGMLLPWYRTWWALLLWLCCALGVASGVAWAYGRRQGRRLALRDVALGAPVPGHGPDVAQQHTAAERANVELHELNHFLEATTVELRDALEQNKEFLGIAAHDLKNPIGGIAGMADFLASGASDLTDDELRDNLVLIRSEAMRAIKLIESLLDDARAGAEGPRLRRRPVDLADIARAVLRWNQAQAEAKRIQLVSRMPASLPAHADASALQRAVDNYVSNAVKYSPPGSRVRLVVSVEAASGDGSASAHIAVEDEGPGLTEDDRARVFGKLQRLSAQPTGGEHSTGLGLYIVKQLVEAHGGEVGVDSEAGKGATFWLRVPLPPPHPFAEPPAAQAGSFSA